MNTKTKISIWIGALFLVFLGIGLSNRQVLAASGLATLRSADISVYVGHAVVSVYAALPSSGIAVPRQGTLGVDPTTLSGADVSGYSRHFMDYVVLSSSSLAQTNLSANIINERPSIDDYYRANSINERPSIDDYYSPSLASVNAALPYSGVSALRQGTLGADLVTLSINAIDENRLINAYSLQAMARSYAVLLSTGVSLSTLSATDIDESRLIDAYRLQAPSELQPRPWR